MDLRVCEDNACPTGVLDCEFGLAVLSGDTTNGAGEMVTVQHFYVFDLEGVEVEVVETEKGNGIL